MNLDGLKDLKKDTIYKFNHYLFSSRKVTINSRRYPIRINGIAFEQVLLT